MNGSHSWASAALASLALAASVSAAPLQVQYRLADAQKHVEKLGFVCEPSSFVEETITCSRGDIPEQWYMVELSQNADGLLVYGNVFALSPLGGEPDLREALSVVLQVAAFSYPGSDPTVLRSWLDRAREHPDDESLRRVEIGGLCFTYVNVGLPKIDLHAVGCNP